MRYWLIKSEPSEISIDDMMNFENQEIAWFGIRNYQARNFMRDQMRIGDLAIFYHSSCAEPGIAGIVEIVSTAYPDETQFKKDNKYFDPKATYESPRWFNVDVRFKHKTNFISLKKLRTIPELEHMRLLSKGNRLSILPVDPKEWEFIQTLLK